MLRVFRYPLKLVARKVARLGVVWPFVYFCRKAITEVHAGEIPVGKPTLLALTPERFRGDLEILTSSGDFRVLKIPTVEVCRILSLFRGSENFDLDKISRPDDDESVNRIHRELRSFLKKFLTRLYKQLKVDCVIGTALWYEQDYDWGLVSDKIGVPYVVLHKENLATAPGHVERLIYSTRRLGEFKGSYIIVHNEIVKDALVCSGYVALDKTSSLGCLRMDSFVKRVKRATKIDRYPSNHHRKKVVLFSFHRGAGLWGTTDSWPQDRNVGLSRLFENVHVAFAQLAMDNSTVDFVIKPKWGGRWLDEIDYVFRKNKIPVRKLENLSIVVDVNVHDLILKSDVVCGFGSTTQLEAAIAGKPVIIPYFDEALRPEYADFIHFKNEFHLFDVAHNPEELKALVISRLDKPMIGQDCMRKRYSAFEKYVSSLNGDALEKYTRVIKRIIRERQNG